ncbi:MAG: hypothetical protein PWP23_607 [Candidatus Sumerlaeota bacterium]|nr:hypothetical protein [Candidatus Sumerlaeota bacterium]
MVLLFGAVSIGICWKIDAKGQGSRSKYGDGQTGISGALTHPFQVCSQAACSSGIPDDGGAAMGRGDTGHQEKGKKSQKQRSPESRLKTEGRPFELAGLPCPTKKMWAQAIADGWPNDHETGFRDGIRRDRRPEGIEGLTLLDFGRFLNP